MHPSIQRMLAAACILFLYLLVAALSFMGVLLVFMHGWGMEVKSWPWIAGGVLWSWIMAGALYLVNQIAALVRKDC